MRLLPTNLEPATLEPLYGGSDRIVIGQREEDLAAVQLDFAQNPLLMVLGDTRTGKTTLLRHIIRTIRDNSTPDRVAFTVLDRRLHLVDEPLFADNEYTANIDRVTPAMLGLSGAHREAPAAGRLLAAQLPAGHSGPHPLPDHRRRRPDTGLSGDERTLCGAAALDTADRIAGAGRRSGAAGHRHGARDRLAHALMTSPLLRRFNDLQATTLMLSGNPTDSGKIRGQRFGRLPAGRAILLADSDIPTYVQLVNPLVDESVKGVPTKVWPLMC